MRSSVEHLEVKEFRNYEWFLLELSPTVTIIQGLNAIGKTNLIEALQLLTEGRSFRNPRWDDVVRNGAERGRISLVVSGPERDTSILMDVERGGRRTYRINGKVQKTVSAATGSVPCVLFTPEDLSLAKGPSGTRRDPVDHLGSQLSASYESLLRKYSRALRQRNAALKDRCPDEEMEAITDILITSGVRLMEHRRRLVERLGPHFTRTYRSISGGREEADITYALSWERAGTEGAGHARGQDVTAEAFTGALQDRASEERARGVTVVGPHRDDIEIRVDGADARRFASQGQQRTIALAWKLSEVAVIEEVVRAEPLLLLDDVMSELDSDRREALAELVAGSVQTVITTTNLHYFDEGLLRRGNVVELS